MNSLHKLLAVLLAPYLVTDCYGTQQYCWDFADALDWMQYCSDFATVSNRYTGNVIAVRLQGQLASEMYS